MNACEELCDQLVFVRPAMGEGATGSILNQMSDAWRKAPAEKGVPKWLPLSVGLGVAAGVVGVLVIVRDISERRRGREVLHFSEERFRNIFEQGPIGVTLIAPDYRMSQVNPAFCQMLGYSQQELTCMTPLDITHPDDIAPSANALRQLFNGATSIDKKIEKRYVTKSGEIIWASLSATVVRDRHGGTLYALGMLEDITERKRSEERLRNVTERLSLATRTASIGIWDLDLSSKRFVWDDTSFEIFGMDKINPVVYEDFARRVHPGDIAAVEASLQRAIERKTQDSVEFRVIRPDGSIRQASSVEGPVADERGNIVRLVGTVVDITERKDMEAQVETTRERIAASARLSALGVMAAGVAHEINNPLAIIHASAVDLLRQIKEEGDVPADIIVRNSQRIVETTHRITRIIKSLRQLAREGSQDRMHPVSVVKILNDTLEVCTERFKQHSVELFIPDVDSALRVPCREVQIGQVLLNLLQNAFEAVVDQPREKWIRLEVVEDHGSAVFSVIDSGKGIPPELRSKIMKPFFTTKEPGKGMGLGLSLSRTMVEEHSGKLELTEKAGHPCFSFSLPLTQRSS